MFCNVNINAVIESIDASTIYDVPLLMLKEQLDKTVLTKLKLPHKNEPDLESWKDFLGRLKNPTSEVRIGLVGKYVELPDAYKSISRIIYPRRCKKRMQGTGGIYSIGTVNPRKCC